MKKAIVLFSGGMDSAVALHVAQRDGYSVRALSFNYGQRHLTEITRARAYCKARQIEHVSIEIPTLQGSALTDPLACIPHTPPSLIGQSIPATYVPARNLLLLSHALNRAEATCAEAIYLGIHAQDAGGYPDCTPAFLQLFQEVVRVGTKGSVRIEAPLVGMTKAAIVRLGRELGVDFGATWSCYDPMPDPRYPTLQTPCNLCDACKLRQQGFQQADWFEESNA